MEQINKAEQGLKDSIIASLWKLCFNLTDNSSLTKAKFLILAEEAIAQEKLELLSDLEENLKKSTGTYEKIRYDIFKQDYFTGV